MVGTPKMREGLITLCLITLVPANIEIPEDGIRQGACSNPDGHGWAVASAEHGLVMGKSMDDEEAIKGFIAERERQGPGSVALFHSRLGTHGSINLANVHPFYVPDARGEGNDKNTVVAHNGVMPGAWHPDRDDPRSDTRVFADRTASWYITERGVPSRRGARALGEMIGRGNKLVFVSVRQPGRPAVRIVNADSGMWSGGVWYSNDWWKRSRPTRTVTYYGSTVGSGVRFCAEKGCTEKFYLAGETKCYKHRPKVYCETEGCHNQVHMRGRTQCATHYGLRPVAVTSTVETEEVDNDVVTDIADALEELGTSDVHPDLACDFCEKKGVIHMATNLCLNCRHCLDCFEEMDNCRCFDYADWMAERDAEAQAVAEAVAEEIDEAEVERLREEAEQTPPPPDVSINEMGEAQQVAALASFYEISFRDAYQIVRQIKAEREVGDVTEKVQDKVEQTKKKSGPKSTATTGR